MNQHLQCAVLQKIHVSEVSNSISLPGTNMFCMRVEQLRYVLKKVYSIILTGCEKYMISVQWGTFEGFFDQVMHQTYHFYLTKYSTINRKVLNLCNGKLNISNKQQLCWSKASAVCCVTDLKRERSWMVLSGIITEQRCFEKNWAVFPHCLSLQQLPRSPLDRRSLHWVSLAFWFPTT